MDGRYSPVVCRRYAGLCQQRRRRSENEPVRLRDWRDEHRAPDQPPAARLDVRVRAEAGLLTLSTHTEKAGTRSTRTPLGNPIAIRDLRVSLSPCASIASGFFRRDVSSRERRRGRWVAGGKGFLGGFGDGVGRRRRRGRARFRAARVAVELLADR